MGVRAGGSYEKMAGRDVTRPLALGKVFEYPPNFVQSFDDYLDLSQAERSAVNGWVDFFYKKYPEVGIVVRARDERYVDPEDVFSAPGDPPKGGIFSDLKLERD
jgi:hypothetical protein